MDTVISFVSPAASLVFESLVTFTAFVRHYIRVYPGFMLGQGALGLKQFSTILTFKPLCMIRLPLVLSELAFGRELNLTHGTRFALRVDIFKSVDFE